MKTIAFLALLGAAFAAPSTRDGAGTPPYEVTHTYESVSIQSNIYLFNFNFQYFCS